MFVGRSEPLFGEKSCALPTLAGGGRRPAPVDGRPVDNQSKNESCEREQDGPLHLQLTAPAVVLLPLILVWGLTTIKTNPRTLHSLARFAYMIVHMEILRTRILSLPSQGNTHVLTKGRAQEKMP
ncbi:hypothetical protein DPSP01_001769 [Paraphaeosphaeria sporulosa]